MNREQKRIFRWWWSWNAEKISAWLEEMARKGWILERTGFAMIVFYFRREAPRRISYCKDFQSGDIKGYKSFIRDAGWVLVSEAGGWHLWARDYMDGESRPEFFSDAESLAARNRRVLFLLAAILMPQFAVFQTILRHLQDSPSPFMIGLGIVHFLIFGFLGYAAVRTIMEVRRLKKKKY